MLYLLCFVFLATLNYRRALQQTTRTLPSVDCGVQTQTEGEENSEVHDLTRYVCGGVVWYRVEYYGDVLMMKFV